MILPDFCIVCHNSSRNFSTAWPGLKQCSHCGHCVADLEIQHFDGEEIYRDEYFCGNEYENYLRDRPVFEKQFRARLHDVKRFQPGGNLIEIGCAYGFFLAVAQQEYCVRGYDIAKGPVTYARERLGLEVYCHDFLDAPIESASADVVVMLDTIEHLPRPDLTISKVAQVLRPGGYLFLTTGDINSTVARVRREKWRLFHPPTHLHYFSRSTISTLMGAMGLQVIQTKYVGVRRSVRQILYSIFFLGKRSPSRLYRAVIESAIGNLSFVVNTHDIMLVVGRKALSDRYSSPRTPL